MGRGRAHRVAVVVLVGAITAVGGPIGLAHAGGNPAGPTRFLLNDSPSYSFLTAAAAPTRDAPAAVGQLSLAPTKGGLRIEVTQLARFRPETELITARVTFYPRRPSVGVTGGFQFPLGEGSGGTVDATTVERSSEGTPESPEVWKPSADLAVISAKYSFPTTTLTLHAKGKYGRMLSDPLTSVGLDLLPSDTTGATAVQPSARVSIGDLTGDHPGLTPGQGTSVGTDLAPQPWITAAVAPDVLRRAAKYLGKASGPLSVSDVNPQGVRVEAYALAGQAQQLRVFLATPFAPVQPGARFAPYTIIVFTPTDATAEWRRGDAYLSMPVPGAEVAIKNGAHKTDFVLRFPEKMNIDFIAVQVVVPGQTGSVLLGTTLQNRF